MTVLFSRVNQFKSSAYEIARNVLRSRTQFAEKSEQQAEQIRELNARVEQLTNQSKRDAQLLSQTQQELEQQRRDNEELRNKPIRLPSDLPLPHHTYGPKMIAMCLNLCKEIGFRPTETAITILFQGLGIRDRVPSWDSIRSWACRAGVAELQRLPEQADDWIWMTDHSNQIGVEKVLQILGIRASNLPAPGQTLSSKDMVVLAVIPGQDWKREDVRRAYKVTADRIGPPRYLLIDGAVELFETADVLETPGKKLSVLRDMKHFAANTFEKLIGKDKRFTSYLSKLGRTRSQIQQTELGHFNPASQKPKARFMNLGPSLRWGQMVSYHLSNSRSQSREGITATRMIEKLGWVKNYRKDLANWNRCQKVMQTSLKYINHQGLFKGAADGLKAELEELTAAWPEPCALSKKMADELIGFVRESESLVEPGERTWLSTENIESSFGHYKKLEGQHSKGGFTSLLAAMPILPIHWTAERVRENFRTVSVKQMNAWVSENLGTTLGSKRAKAYKEFAVAVPG